VNKWIDENAKRHFQHHTCMFADQVLLFFVGGPNERGDYHLQEGEEVFFQYRGDLTLKILVGGQRRDVLVREGEVFVCPAYTQHCPKRAAGAVGSVLERGRRPHEMDCLRNFTDDTQPNPTVLWERWIHFNDMEDQLQQILDDFDASEENRTRQPGPGSFAGPPAKFQPKPTVKLDSPIHLQSYVEKHLAEITAKPHPLFAGLGTNAHLTLYGAGKHQFQTKGELEMLLHFQRGQGQLNYEKESATLKTGNMVRIRPNKTISLNIAEGGVCLVVQIIPQ